MCEGRRLASICDGLIGVEYCLKAGTTEIPWCFKLWISGSILANRAGGVWGQDCLRSGETIGAGVWPGIWRQEPAPDDPICRGVPGAGDCRITDTTIELDPLHRADPAEQATTARLLRGDVPGGTLERECTAREDRRDALRAHGPFQKARQTGGAVKGVGH